MWRLIHVQRAAERRERQARKDFLALLNHEIRTPLHGWLALVDLLDGTVMDSRQRQYLSLLRRTAHQLDRLTGDVLLAAEAGDWPPPLSHQAVSTTVSAALPPALPQGCRLLFADDVELNRLVLREFLADTGAQVDEAADGAEALVRLESGGYDLIILDLRMPVMDGFAAARAIREREERLALPPIPLVALSAGTGAEDRKRAAEAGFTLFLPKPVDRFALIAALADLLPASADTAPPPNIPEGLEHMLPLFVAEMDKDAVALQALADGPATALAEHAHAMRGKCGMFGEDILFQLLTQLEDDANAERRGEWSPLIAGIVERADQLKIYGPAPSPMG